MRRSMFLLSLIAVLAGSPLRHAEAAADLARSIAGLAGRVDIEAIDGGVGDDDGSSIREAVGVGGLAIPAILATTADLVPPSWSTRPSSPGLILAASEDRAATLPIGTAGRHAWLQRFLF